LKINQIANNEIQIIEKQFYFCQLKFSINMEIAIENLVKRYGNQAAVDHISFQLKPGEILGFLGPNGAGKTTTMRIVSCFMAPSSGDVLLNGKSVFDNPTSFRKKIGYLPENNPLYYDMFVIDFLTYISQLQQVEKSKIPARVNEVISYVGLSNEKHKRIGELSKGYKQRVGLAQALIHEPELLILDEPTSGLDPNQIIEIRELIRNLGKQKTILLSTHILQEVEALCDRIIIINKGKIVTDSTPAQLQQNISSNGSLQVYIEPTKTNDNVLKQLMTLKYCNSVVQQEQENHFEFSTSNSYLLKKEVFDLCKINNWYLLEMHEVEARLEDIFRKLTTEN